MTDSPSKRLFILDGMALAYRAHFAFFSNPIRNSKGVNTSAVYGFANTLLGILEAAERLMSEGFVPRNDVFRHFRSHGAP